jgi:hypothetical protein
MPMTGYDKYLMDVYKDVPVVTAIASIDRDGNFYAKDTYDSKYTEKLKDYRMIQYNNVVDYKHRIEDFFRLK